MQLSLGLQSSINNLVCHLQRSFYGLKQARCNGIPNSLILLSHNYNFSTADHSLLLKHDGNHTTTILVYVDGIVFTGNNPTEISNITSFLHKIFRIKNLGGLT